MDPRARATYLSASVSTARPERLLVMLYDRLVLDLRRGIEAQREERYDAAATELLHAQDIVNELRASLRTDAWDGAAGLAAIYDWLFGELVRANVSRDVAVSESCLAIVEPLAETWREAVAALAVVE